jgi:arsenate reductase
VNSEPSRDTRARVLFICTGNTARSQMAEGLLRALAGQRFDVHSGGLEPGAVHPLAVQVMKERGIDVSSQHAKSFDQYLGRLTFAYVITLCERAARGCPVFAGTGERLDWRFDDPSAASGSGAERPAKFREVRDAIETRIREWLATMPAR